MTEYVQFSTKNLKEWELAIVREFPDIYLTPNPRILELYKNQNCEQNLDKENFCNLRFGFEFRSGWSKLVREFSKVTVDYVAEIRKIYPDAYVRSFIFKEKFGSLTWQGSHNLPGAFSDVYWGYVSRLATMSTHTCERTGKFGILRNVGGVMITLCDEEHEKFIEQRKQNNFSEWAETAHLKFPLPTEA